MYLSSLQCTECSSSFDPNELHTLCKSCASPLVARYDLAAIARDVRRDELATRPADMWRYRELLPPGKGHEVISLGEGGSPLLALPRLGRELGLAELYLKDEGQNPTGSFKARGMSVAVSMAKALGAKALCAPSAGNAGGALASYGARAGLPVYLAMPEDVPPINLIEARCAGAHVELIAGNITDCGKWLREHLKDKDCFDLSTLKEPYRVEGKKTMGFELAEAFAWDLPDVILYPTGGGTGLVGMWKAFEELKELGWLKDSCSFPRMVCVQAQGCAPVVDAFHAGRKQTSTPEHPKTLAAGLRVPNPVGDRWMLRVLRASEGNAIAVSDDALIAASKRLAQTEGIFPAPEAGSLVAALEELLAQGWLDPKERIVLLQTAAGIKYPECFAG